MEELTEAFNEGLLTDDEKDANRNEEDASQDLLLDDVDEDEIIGQTATPIFIDFEGLELFRHDLSRKFDSVIWQGNDIFLFVPVNVNSPLPRCSSRLAPFCSMKNCNTHACIVFALSSTSQFHYFQAIYYCYLHDLLHILHEEQTMVQPRSSQLLNILVNITTASVLNYI